MKTLNLTYVGRLAELSARAWNLLPLRGNSLIRAREAVEFPDLAKTTVMRGLRVSPEKSLNDLRQQRFRMNQKINRAIVATGPTAPRYRTVAKRAAVMNVVDDYLLTHANPLLGKRFREMQAILRTPVVAFARGDNEDSATRKIVRRIGIGTAIAGAATLPAAIPMLKIAARNKIPGAGGNVPAKFIPDYITAGQRALNGPLTGKIAGAVIQRKRAATTPGTLPRFMADHYARFRAGPREALGHWQYEVGESLANKIKAKGGDVAANPAMKRFLTGAQATQNKINEGLWQHGLNETEAIRRALADPSKPVSDYGRLMMTHKAAASMKYAKIAAASPALLVGGGAMAIAARKRRDRDEKTKQMQAVMQTPVRFFAKADSSDPKRLVQLRGPAPAKKPDQESWLSRNKWKLAGAGAMLTGIGVMASLRDKGMKMPLNPHQSVGEELVGIKSQAAKDYEASMRAAAKKTIRADKKVSTAAAAAIQPQPGTPKAAAIAAPKQPAAVKRTLTNPEVIQRATDKAWSNYKAGKLSGPKVLRVYQKFWGADATKGTSIPDKLTGKAGAALRGRARSLAIDKLKKGWGPIAQMPKGQGSLALAAVARMPIVFFNEADPDQYNQFAPSLYVGSMYRKGRRALTWVKRSGNISQDAADAAAGKAPEPGKKREWQKSWFKNAVGGLAVGAGLYGTPKLYASLVGRKTGGRVRPTPTWGGLISSARAGDAKLLLPQKKLEAALRTPVQFARGDQTIKALARWGKNTGNLNGVRQQLAISSGFLRKAPQTLRLWGKEGVARYRSAMAEDLVMRRRAGQLSAAGAGLVHLEDWRLADMRGNSARVFSPKAKTRDRREKTEWEKAATQRKVRNVAIGAAVGLAGLSAYLGVKNMKLRRAGTPPVSAAVPAGDAVEAAFKATAKVPSMPVELPKKLIPKKRVVGSDIVVNGPWGQG